MLRRRYRHGPYALAEPESPLRYLKPIVVLAVAVLVLYMLGSWVLRLFDAGNSIRSTAADLQVEERGTVSVSLDEGELKRVENDLPLHPGDRVTTGGGAHASVTFFDGTRLRMEENTDLTIDESDFGSKRSALGLTLDAGSIWIATPAPERFSGSILRTLQAPAMTLEFPARTEALLTPTMLAVFSSDGLGVAIQLNGADEPVVIGEGQQYMFPADVGSIANLYENRTPLDAQLATSAFVNESRSLHREVAQVPATTTGSGTMAPVANDDVLVVETPADDAVIRAATVEVSGRVSAQVSRVRVNGYEVPVTEARSFSQELALPDEERIEITIEAMDSAGLSLARTARTITRDLQPPSAPTITSPAAAGTVYRTQDTEFEIIGGAPAGTTGIIVNDYRLQLFQPGDTTWSYLASENLGNMKQGENVYNVRALNAAGIQSEPATITIILGEGEEGVVSAPSSASSVAPVPSELPTNDPLQPGSLQVTGPTAGTQHTATGSELLIEGNVPSGTNSVWVNEYQLQLFEPGKTFFNYIASVELGTMKAGSNTYTILARNAENQIIDRVVYTITYNP